MPHIEDQELIDATLAGDDGAFKTLMERYAPLVAGCFYGKTRNPADAEELVGDVFFSAYCRLGRLRSAGSLGPWLVKIARNKLRDFYRGQKRRPRLGSIEANALAPAAEWAGNVADPAPDPAERLEVAQFHRTVAEAMGRLNGKYRLVLYLKLFEELSSPEIAARLGMKESAVRMRTLRGLRILRQDLRKQGIAPPGKA